MNNRNKFIFLLSIAICAYIAWSFVSIFIHNNKKTEFFTLFKKAPFVGKQYEALVVTCIDMTKEQREATHKYLISKGYDDNYIMYSISADYDKKALHKTIEESIRNYNIQEVILIGHMSCIAMRKSLELDKISEPKETRWISKNLKMMKKELERKYRKSLTITTRLLNLRNVMEDINI
jgi:carbonic anhydrase